jgi:hypothetical protein
MEDDQNTENSMPMPQETPNVSFPTVGGGPQKSGGAKTLLIVGILVLVGILGFVIYKSASSKKDEVLTEATPFDNLTTEDTTVATSTPVATATPKPADKSTVSIEIQNGTGISGEAAYLQTQLKALGYTDIKVGNATTTDATATVVTFSKDLAQSIVDEITLKLKSIYQTVTVKTATSTQDVLIVTGLRKGATAKPSATPTGTPKASTSPTPTATP